MSIYIVGDTHGDIDFHKLNSHNFPDGKNLTKDDYVIICGDVAAVWDAGKQDKYLQDWYTNKPWTTLFVDGNHENHAALNNYPVEEWHGGKVHFITPSLIHLMRGQVFNIDGFTFFTFGGAVSLDKVYRKEGVSWWPEEVPTGHEMGIGVDNLQKYDYKVDYVISHCAPTMYVSKMFNYCVEGDPVTQYLNILIKYYELTFSHWYCGHYHIDKDIDDSFTAVYNDIIKIC